MATVSTVIARNEFATIVNRAAFGRERVILERRGKPIAAVVSIEDLELLRALEDRADIRDAIAAEREAREKGSISLADLKRDLGV